MAFNELITHPMALPVSVPLLAGLLCLLIPNTASAVRAWLAALAAAVVMALVWPLFQQAGEAWEPLIELPGVGSATMMFDGLRSRWITPRWWA